MAMDKNYEVLLNASLERYEKMIEKGAVDSEEFSASKLSKIENTRQTGKNSKRGFEPPT